MPRALQGTYQGYRSLLWLKLQSEQVEVRTAAQWSSLPSVVTWNNLNANEHNLPCDTTEVSKLRPTGYFLLSSGGKT